MTNDRASKIDIIGHSAVLAYLEKALEHNRVHHAYLFSGPSQIGKSTLARWFIKKLLCLNSAARDCDCGACAAFDAGRHVDFVEIVKNSDSDKLGVEQVRLFQDSVRRRPGTSNRIVGLIDSIDQSSESAMNALLKILEEPPQSAVIILLSDQPDRILPTIKSRCQTIAMHPVDISELAQALQARGLKKSESLTNARLAGGRPGLALLWQQDPQLQSQHLDLAKRLMDLSRLKLIDRLEQLKNYLVSDRASFSDSDEQLLSHWLLIIRELLLAKLKLKELAVYRVMAGPVSLAAESIDLSSLSSFARQLWRGIERSKRNVNSGLNFSNLTINYGL